MAQRTPPGQELALSTRAYYYNRMERGSEEKMRRLLTKNYRDVRSFDKILYWILLLLAIIGNLIISIVLVPLLAVLNQTSLLIVLAIVAVTFGILFSSLLRDIENLNSNAYVIGGIFLPIQALINVYFITMLANEVSAAFQLTNWHNPLVIGIVYMCGFIAPYAFRKAFTMRDKLTTYLHQS